MNKRITEKRYKRKFQKGLARSLEWAFDMRVKPSRIKLKIHENQTGVVMIGRTQGIEIKCTITSKERTEDD